MIKRSFPSASSFSLNRDAIRSLEHGSLNALPGDQSAYTVIVAQQVNLYQGPNLYLNANYGATSVPVPKGVGPVSGKLMLTQ